MVTKSPFTYYGGKQTIISKIAKYVPDHKVYCEPFCGGATMLFAKRNFYGSNFNDYKEVINDTNKLIYNFFVQLRDNGDKLCQMLQKTVYSEELYRVAKNYNGDCDLYKAYYFFVNAMSSFSSIIGGGWAFAKKGNHCYRFKNKVNKLHEFVERMKYVYLNNTDAIKCMSRWDSEDTFFYCDPPYIDALFFFFSSTW